MADKNLFRIFIITAAVLFSGTLVLAQSSSLYMPRDIKSVYEGGTRSFDGAPGPEYWQNEADYSIIASVDTSDRSIHGTEKIIYTNNSPDTLNLLVFRLYQNLYMKGGERDMPIDTPDITNGVNLVMLKIEGKEIDLSRNNPYIRMNGTILAVNLPEPLNSKDSLEVDAEWSFTMPRVTDLRMGMLDSTSYFVGYWFPQISVYDDIRGWDITPHTGNLEFYNNFGNFNVQITVPQNFLVWATGVLQNPGDVLTEKYLKRMRESEKSDSVIHIITQYDLLSEEITARGENTWKFKAENVTDFAFATSDHNLWDAGSVVVDDKTGRRTTVGAVYPLSAKDFPDVARIGMKAIRYYSTEIPGVPFPYPKMTVVNGQHDGGMEYPMMVNDVSASVEARTYGVTAHEIAHTYFPFYMGINETFYAWMDEGWATALPADIPFKVAPLNYSKKSIAARYESFAGKQFEMPMMVPSTQLRGESYSIASYNRPAESYLFLKDMLGDKDFLKGLRLYMKRWHGKHPLPYDFFFSFNDALSENLDWYWKPWFFESGAPDLGIKDVKSNGGLITVDIEKLGSIPVPAKVKVMYIDGSEDNGYKTAAAWKEGNNLIKFVFKSDKDVDKVLLGDDDIPDTDKSNNVFYSR